MQQGLQCLQIATAFGKTAWLGRRLSTRRRRSDSGDSDSDTSRGTNKQYLVTMIGEGEREKQTSNSIMSLSPTAAWGGVNEAS